MWPTIDRARRRLTGAPDDPALGTADGSTAARQPAPPSMPLEAAATSPRRVEDVVIILGRVELDQLRVALQNALGDEVERPNTPARLERALSLLLARRGAPGRPRVLRRPAAVSAPESWEIHLDGVDRSTGTAVRDASRTGGFAK